MSKLPGPHGYLSCEDTQYSCERRGKALRRIVERGCIHCSAWEIAASALGLTFHKPEHVPNSEERLLDRIRAERDAVRALADQLAGSLAECGAPHYDDGDRDRRRRQVLGAYHARDWT